MDRTIYKNLQEELESTVKEGNVNKINKLRELLNISDEQSKYFIKGLTGYPSVDKVWLKYYNEGVEEQANNIPLNKTVWDIIEEKLYEYYDIPALEYFKRIISKQEFIDSIYTWARAFRAMGVEHDEVVPVYGPFVPDICAMTFALNMIGACPYFLKLAISMEALAEETKDSKIAVVYDGMWSNVAEEFSKDRFKRVIVATVTQDMPSPKKEIVSFISKIQSLKNKSKIPNDKKYIWLDQAKDIANYYSGEVKVPFEKDRTAFITSSSGTTIGGIVKGVMASNESTISQLFMGKNTVVQYVPGDRCLNHFPPTASTSLNVLFLLALYQGETVVLDPRVSEKAFYNQIIKLRPNVALHTGSAWEAFFTRVEKEMGQGKKFDFSYAKAWTVGGEGSDIRKFKKWNKIMEAAHAQQHLFSGYGLSELFSAASVEKVNARYDFSKPIMSVGVPYGGINMGVFDESGNELSYNQRGELRIKSKSAMKGYYNKPEMTAQMIDNGWVKTGDYAEIDENGFVYIWGRVKDSIELENGNKLFLFDVANKIKESSFIDDAIVLSMPTSDNVNNLVAHIVWKETYDDKTKAAFLTELNKILQNYLPTGVELFTYSEHKGMLPYSPTTLKKDKNRLSRQEEGFIQVSSNVLNMVDFELSDDGYYLKKKNKKGKQKILSKNRK